MKRILLVAVLGLLVGCGRQPGRINADLVAGEPERVADKGEAKADKPAEKGDGFPFRDDRAGEVLAKELAPTGHPQFAEVELAGPRSHPGLRSLDEPTLTPPARTADVPRYPLPKPAADPKPGTVPEGLPLAYYSATPKPPEGQSLSTAPLTRLASRDVNEPLAPPSFSQVVPDRAPLDDPSLPSSIAAAVAASPPVRSNPAPFVKVSVPDPFENRQAAKVRTPPVEDPQPVAATPKRP